MLMISHAASSPIPPHLRADARWRRDYFRRMTQCGRSSMTRPPGDDAIASATHVAEYRRDRRMIRRGAFRLCLSVIVERCRFTFGYRRLLP